MAISLRVARSRLALLRRWRDVALRGVGALAKKVLVHLLRQIVARFLVGKIEPVLVDQHLLQFEPLFPRLFRHVLKYPLAELSRIGRKIEPFGFASELNAFDRSCHATLQINNQMLRNHYCAQSGILSGKPEFPAGGSGVAATLVIGMRAFEKKTLHLIHAKTPEHVESLRILDAFGDGDLAHATRNRHYRLDENLVVEIIGQVADE